MLCPSSSSKKVEATKPKAIDSTTKCLQHSVKHRRESKKLTLQKLGKQRALTASGILFLKIRLPSITSY